MLKPGRGLLMVVTMMLLGFGLLDGLSKAEAQKGKKPPPRKPPPPKKVVPAGGGLHLEYRELAQVLSQDYLLDGRTVDPEPVKPMLERMSNSAREPDLLRAAREFLKGMEIAEQARLAVESANDESRRRAAARVEALRGNDENLVPYVANLMILYRNPVKDPALEAQRRRIALDGSRARAWNELLPAVPAQFAGRLTQRPLVGIEFLADGPGGRPISATTVRPEDTLPGRSTFLGRYVARNLAPHDLHYVTFAVEMFHFSTLPEATLRHVYFVPVWRKGGVLEFSRNFIPDWQGGGKRYRVPSLERRPDGGGFAVASELSMMAGIVRMQAAVWCDEARQPPTPVDLPERRRIVAERLVKLAEEQATSVLAVTPKNVPIKPSPFAPKPGKQPPEKTAEERTQFMLETLLQPVLAFMPADADVTKRAKRLLDDFPSVREELLKNKDNSLLAACAEGKRYVGGGEGELAFGLLFLSCDAQGKKIRAEVFNPAKPERRRLVAGFIAKDYRTQANMIMLEPLYPNQEIEIGFVKDTRINMLQRSVKSYRFRLGDGVLVGEASTYDLSRAGSDPERGSLILKETSGDPRELAEARKRNEAGPREQPRAPFAMGY